MTPYYQDDAVTIYHADWRDVDDWYEADALVTDPPYGRAWRQGRLKARWQADDSHGGIEGDWSTELRDMAVEVWGEDKPAILFGDLMLPVRTRSPWTSWSSSSG